MDKITLTRMEFFGYHGVFAEENKLGQRFYVDADLFMSLAEAGESDNLELTINYAEVYYAIEEIMEKETFKLLEALAARIADTLLTKFSRIEEITVRVIKPHPPFKIFFEGVTIEIHRKRTFTAYIGLGSNMGNREQYLEEGIRLLNRTPDVRVTRKSSVYETDPFGFTDQDPFLNMAVEVKTGLSSLELLHRMLEIELKLGRKREVRWGPRTLDLDLLSYNRQTWTSPELILPHPGVKERAFVLIPLQEIAPDDAIPGIPSLAQHELSLQGKEGVRKWTTTSSPNESGLSGS